VRVGRHGVARSHTGGLMRGIKVFCFPLPPHGSRPVRAAWARCCFCFAQVVQVAVAEVDKLVLYRLQDLRSLSTGFSDGDIGAVHGALAVRQTGAGSLSREASSSQPTDEKRNRQSIEPGGKICGRTTLEERTLDLLNIVGSRGVLRIMDQQPLHEVQCVIH
jgi:hypothetical protein